jgi:hypothetical protein
MGRRLASQSNSSLLSSNNSSSSSNGDRGHMAAAGNVSSCAACALLPCAAVQINAATPKKPAGPSVSTNAGTVLARHRSCIRIAEEQGTVTEN